MTRVDISSSLVPYVNRSMLSKIIIYDINSIHSIS